MPNGIVLSIHADPAVLCTRAMLLETEGYEVMSAGSLEQIARLKDYSFDLVIIGFLGSPALKLAAYDLVRAAWGEIPVIEAAMFQFVIPNALYCSTTANFPAELLEQVRKVFSSPRFFKQEQHSTLAAAAGFRPPSPSSRRI